MKETGLMFKAPLVRSILDGSKTQARRVVKPQPVIEPSGIAKWEGPANRMWCGGADIGTSLLRSFCPFGQAGDRIYVRETFVQGFNADPVTGDRLQWDPDGNALPMTTWYRATDQIDWSDDDGWEANTPWKPAIHMPKALARIWLEITSVRVERLQDISEADCRAEGAHGGHGSIPGYAYSATPLEHFEHIWTSTGGDWAANPWVWVIDFKRDLAQGGQ